MEVFFNKPNRELEVDTKIICIEGLDGSGKTTLINKLDVLLCDRELNVTVLTPFMVAEYGTRLKMDILNSKNHFRELTGMSYLLYSLQNQIEEYLNKTKNKYDLIILDRYIPSFYTYQIYNNKQDIELATRLLEYLHENSPDIHHSYLVRANIINTNNRLNKNIVDDGDLRTLANYDELSAGYIDYYRKYSPDTKIFNNNNLVDLDIALRTIIEDISKWPTLRRTCVLLSYLEEIMFSSKLGVLNAFMAGMAASSKDGYVPFNPLNNFPKKEIDKPIDKEQEEAIVKAAEDKRKRKAQKRILLLRKVLV